MVAFFAAPQFGGDGYAEGMTMVGQLKAQLICGLVGISPIERVGSLMCPVQFSGNRLM